MDFTYLTNYMDRLTSGSVPGNEIVIWHKGTQIFRYWSGFSDKERKIPMKGGERVYLYSSTKVATVTAALQLFEQGYFQMTDPLSEFLPEYGRMTVKRQAGQIENARNPITVRDLFAMTAGINYDLQSPSIMAAYARTGCRMNTREVIRSLAAEPLSFEPGTRWEYGLCHDVLGALVEELSGLRLSEYMRRHIFKPLEMDKTCFHLPEKESGNISPQYWYNPTGNAGAGKAERREPVNEYVFGPEYDSGGAGIISSADDYIKLVYALSNFGLGANGYRVLSARTVELLRTNQLAGMALDDYSSRFQRGYGYGLGVRTHIDRSQSCSLSSLGEFGWSGAAGSLLLCDPAESLAVFYVQHLRNYTNALVHHPLKNVIYACLDR